MCGIAGIIRPENTRGSIEEIEQMSKCLQHRGPDARLIWENFEANISLSHNRLSIIDINPRSNQPMTGFGYLTIVHNGEIYNYIEIRNLLKLKGYNFQTNSDTEVILAAYDHYGESCVEHLDGMFAFAIWNEKDNTLFCARDRFGEKPFFYHHDKIKKRFIFSSEIKAIHTLVEKGINNRVLVQYLTEGLTSIANSPELTFYENIYQLEPSHTLKYNNNSTSLIINRYWNCPQHIVPITENDASDQFHFLFVDSIKKRLRSDVSIGNSLSGGLDSASIAFYIKELTGNLKTFSAVFPGFERDESSFVNIVSRSLQSESHLVTPTTSQLASEIDDLIFYQEQPISDPSCYAQYKVFQLAAQQKIKVLLDGQGADETLGGYSRYLHWYLQELIRKGKLSKAIINKNELIQNNQPLVWDHRNWIAAFLPRTTSRKLRERLIKKITSDKNIHPDFLHQYFSTNDVFKPVISSLNEILHFDTFKYGLQDLLRYADRNSMAHGCEVRLPFLSHTLVEFVFSLPGDFKIRQGFSKWILRKFMDKKLPKEVVWRKLKIGFEVPTSKWMDEPLIKEMVHQSKNELVSKGILSKNILMRKPQEDPVVKWRYLVTAKLLS